MLIAFTDLHAQDFHISFAGSGETTTVETVQVQNLTQGTSLNLSGSDVLHLTVSGTGVEQIPANRDNTLHIYPNPMINNSIIEFELPKANNIIIELYDIAGKKVTSIQKALQSGIQKFNVSGLNSGIYTVIVKSDNIIYSGKVISISIAKGKADIAFITGSINVPKAKLKNAKEIISMQYTTGDRILLKAVSGNYSTIKTLVPVENSTETFNFVTATDYDGNNYTTVTIDKQTWMVENLKVTHYRNGDPISNVTDNVVWTALSTGAYCDYNNTSSNSDIYGRLYNWFAVSDIRNIAPTGWHVPTDTEWTTLSSYLGGNSIAGGKMKATTGWKSPNTGATNESGFTALPSGYRYGYGDGTFGFLTTDAIWRSSTSCDISRAWSSSMYYHHANFYLDCQYSYKTDGNAIRLIKD